MNRRVQKLIFLVCGVFLTGAVSAQNFCTFQKEVPLCPNQTFIVDGIPYGAPWVVTDTLPSQTGGCDTIITYNLTPRPYIKASKNVGFCSNASVTIDGLVFNEAGVYFSNNPVASTSGGCDTLFTYFINPVPLPTRTDTIVLTPGQSVVLAGTAYQAPNTVTEIVPASTGCDTLRIYRLLLDATFPDTCSKNTGFLKVIGQAGVEERSSVICTAADGNFYLAGERQQESLLMKIDPDGRVLWTRVFRPLPNTSVRITDLLEDSDGMLTGCGIVSPDTSAPEAYVFRYDPLTGNLMWSRYIKQGKPEAFSILEKQPGGTFLLLISPQLVNNLDDVEIWELNRNNGQLASAIQHYTFGTSDVWSNMVLHDGSIYAVGRHIPGSIVVPVPLERTRAGLSRIDLTTGAPVWSRLGHLDDLAFTTLFGTDLLIHDQTVVSLSSGFDSLFFDGRSSFFLQKTSLDGNLLWMKKFSIPGVQLAEAHDVERMSDGYVLTGEAEFGTDNWNKIVVKTDFDGNVLWARRVASGIYPRKEKSYFLHNQQSVVVNDVLYSTGVSEEAIPDILLLKMNAAGEVSDTCGFVQPLTVMANSVLDPVNQPIQVAAAPFIVASVNTPATTAAIQMEASALCLRCCEPVLAADSLGFCPGASVMIGGIVYDQPGTVIDTLSSPAGVCADTIITYTLYLLPQPTRAETVEFCPGDTVFIGGNAYTQPGIVLDTLPALAGCDTVVTYTLQFIDPPASDLIIDCPDDIDIATNPGTGPVAVPYLLPVAESDCTCPGLALTLLSGLPSGASFPPGTTTVCYVARDSCGSSATCCFEVTIREEQPCDVKTNGCLKWELLSITKNAGSDLTYRIRVTNNCSNQLIYGIFELPAGLVAVAPANNSVYQAPSGRLYEARNPNFSPFYSIRFKSQSDSIANGQSEVFEYVLPGQAPPVYIHVGARLSPNQFYEAYLNTFNCPVKNGGNKAEQRSDLTRPAGDARLQVFPNPTGAMLYADLTAWSGQRVELRVLDSRGVLLRSATVQAADLAQPVPLPEALPGGLYLLEAVPENAARQSVRFVVQR